MKYAQGGLITRPDSAPIYTETLLALRCDGYLLSASVVRELGANGIGILAALNHKQRDDA